MPGIREPFYVCHSISGEWFEAPVQSSLTHQHNNKARKTLMTRRGLDLRLATPPWSKRRQYENWVYLFRKDQERHPPTCFSPISPAMLATLSGRLKFVQESLKSARGQCCGRLAPAKRVTLTRSYTSSTAPVRPIASILSTKTLLQSKTTVQGWVRSVRDQKSNTFIDVNDGSSLANLQLLVSSAEAAKYAPNQTQSTFI
jgi:hypothetical protein